MAKLTSEQGDRLNSELVTIFQSNPSESYQAALETVHQRHPDLSDLVVISDLNYRVPKLRREGQIPSGGRSRGKRAGASTASSSVTHPVARAYQELDDAKRAMEEAQSRYQDAQSSLRQVLKESLPQDFLEGLTEG